MHVCQRLCTFNGNPKSHIQRDGTIVMVKSITQVSISDILCNHRKGIFLYTVTNEPHYVSVVDFTMDGQLFGEVFFHIMDKPFHCDLTLVLKNSFINFSKCTSSEIVL